MFRLKMAASLLVLLLLVVVLAVALYWGSHEAEHYYQRSDLAHDVIDAHLVLAEHVDRYFQEKISSILLDTNIGQRSLGQIRESIDQGFIDARFSIEQEREFIKNKEPQNEGEVNDRLIRLEQLLLDSQSYFDQAANLKNKGKLNEAMLIISEAYTQIFEGQMWPIIHSVVREKRQEVEGFGTQETRIVGQLTQLAFWVPGAAVVLTLLVGFHLYRSLTFPLEKLLEGARRIGSGDRGYRIPSLGRNEFGHLGHQFNAMSSLVERQQLELLNANALLESQVAERTQELRQANESLQQMAALRSRFFADISHELRTPLTIIRGEAEVSLRSKVARLEDYRESMKYVVDLAAHMSRLVDDLFYLSRSEAGGLRYEPELLEFNGLLNSCLQECDNLVASAGLTLTADYPEIETCLMADRGRLRQMLLIVIDNACRYSPDGGCLSFNMYHSDNQVCLEVSDQGVGIAEADLEVVFERHYRAARGAELVNNGAGLGLPLARAIVKNHQGSIYIESKQGVGTTVVINLPLHLGVCTI